MDKNQKFCDSEYSPPPLVFANVYSQLSAVVVVVVVVVAAVAWTDLNIGSIYS
jgi:hypothetical protein